MTHAEDDDRHARGEAIPVSGPEVRLGPPLPRRLSDVLDNAFALMDARAEGREKPISTPWRDINEQLDGGFWPGCHVLVGGTGAGKSAWALQLALHALHQGTRVVYVSLELDEEQIALRLAGELTRRAWSKLYNGQASAADRELAREQRQLLASLPLYIESGTASGWTPQRMVQIVESLRAEDAQGPLLVVVDFLQLVGCEPEERVDVRERIGRAAYAARGIARQYKATALLISSVARNNYASVSDYDVLSQARLSGEAARGILLDRIMFRADALVGMGKESGEIEYAADSVTIAVSLPSSTPRTARSIVFATAKLRSGRPGWSVLQFDGHRFADAPDGGLAVLTQLTERSPKPAATTRRARPSSKLRVVGDAAVGCDDDDDDMPS